MPQIRHDFHSLFTSIPGRFRVPFWHLQCTPKCAKTHQSIHSLQSDARRRKRLLCGLLEHQNHQKTIGFIVFPHNEHFSTHVPQIHPENAQNGLNMLPQTTCFLHKGLSKSWSIFGLVLLTLWDPFGSHFGAIFAPTSIYKRDNKDIKPSKTSGFIAPKSVL